jgi:hypothetical protein
MRSARHETRALLRAHLSAVAGTGHLTGQCAVCRWLQRLAMQAAQEGPEGAHKRLEAPARTAERKSG